MLSDVNKSDMVLPHFYDPVLIIFRSNNREPAETYKRAPSPYGERLPGLLFAQEFARKRR